MPTTNPTAPSITVRWMRPAFSTQHLQLPSAPIPISPSLDTWTPLSPEDSTLCEAAWKDLPEEQRLRSGTTSPSSEQTTFETDIDVVGIAISDEKLFEVDVRSMELRPIYWRLNAPPIKVCRATWMYNESKPVPEHIANQIDRAYESIQPWQPSYGQELETAAALGAEAYEKLQYRIYSTKSPDFTNNSSDAANPTAYVIFEDAFTAKIMSNNKTQIFTSPLFGRRANGVTVYYGYEAAVRAKYLTNLPHSPPNMDAESAVTPGETVDKLVSSDETAGNSTTNGLIPAADPSPQAVNDLVLVIHGIGQGLASQYEAWDFVYPLNIFRQHARKQATLPALASILRDKKVQFLPIRWRTSFKVGEEEERERARDGLDNTFSVADITLRKTIPAIRELSNNVFIDIFYFMSRHQRTMIESVCLEANRVYRRWCARNPGFEKRGRVHIIGHSLGSLLAAQILSTQPTFQPPLSEMDPVINQQYKNQFLFNTSAFFIVGSPLAIFVHLDHAQIIARKGRERTKESPGDEALDRQGIFGCLSVDSLYNVFNPSDPIAYMINPCVDSEKAKSLPPSLIPTHSLASSFSQRVTRFFGFNGAIPRSLTGSKPAELTKSAKPELGRELTSIELGGHEEALRGSRAERRFAALNPHGTLDFQLASEGSISEYVDMITAHSSYWQSPDLAAFILVELFASKQDLLRTGLVPAVPKS